MTYQPLPSLNTTVGEARAWTIDTETLDTLMRIAETLERIHQQLVLITGADINPGETLK